MYIDVNCIKTNTSSCAVCVSENRKRLFFIHFCGWQDICTLARRFQVLVMPKIPSYTAVLSICRLAKILQSKLLFYVDILQERQRVSRHWTLKIAICCCSKYTSCLHVLQSRTQAIIATTSKSVPVTDLQSDAATSVGTGVVKACAKGLLGLWRLACTKASLRDSALKLPLTIFHQ